MLYTKTYPSGLCLVAQRMEHLYTVSVGMYVNVGSVRETAKQNGYSHFIEHLMFKGTSNRTCAQISESMENIGAQFNAFTSKDNTCYYTKSAFGDLEKCLDLLSDMYFNSTFDEKELQKEKSVVIEEIAMNDDHPDDVCQDLISMAAYDGQKIGQTILGNIDNIKYCDRHSIVEYKQKYYVPTNTVISVAGKFDFDQLDKQIEQYFERNFSKDVFGVKVEEEEQSQYSTKYLSRTKDSEQSHISLAFRGCSIDQSDAPVYALMTSILGGGMSSRLFQSVREQHGLAYTVYAYSSSSRNSGYVEIYCGTGTDNVAKLSKLLNNVIVDFKQNGITKEELNRAKAIAINGIYMAVEDSLNVMMANGRRMLKLGAPLDIDKRISAINKVSASDIVELARKVFVAPYASCYVGKQCDSAQDISTLSLK